MTILFSGYKNVANCNLKQLGYRGRNAVHYCAVSGMLEAMEYLWDNFRNVYDFKEKDFDDKTPLDLAMEYKNDNVTEFLIGALNITDITCKYFTKKNDFSRVIRARILFIKIFLLTPTHYIQF